MAEIKKEKDVIDKAFDPKKLSSEELRLMYEKYSKYKAGYSGKFVTWPKDIFMNKHKLMTFSDEHGWAHHVPKEQEFADWRAKWLEYESYWEQFEDYKLKRKYAEQQTLKNLERQN